MENFIIFIITFTFYVVGYQGYNFYKRIVEKEYEGKEPARELDISEPIISFVNTFKENPKRFTYVEYEGYVCSLHTDYRVLTDTFTGEVFKIAESHYGWSIRNSEIKLTADEIDYIDREIMKPYRKRKNRYHRIVNERKELQERRRLTKIYKQEK